MLSRLKRWWRTPFFGLTVLFILVIYQISLTWFFPSISNYICLVLDIGFLGSALWIVTRWR